MSGGTMKRQVLRPLTPQERTVAEQNHDLLFNADGTYTDRARKIIAGTPMGRFGNPEELIGAALFLASDETASFVNGIVLPVDGGYSAYSGV